MANQYVLYPAVRGIGINNAYIAQYGAANAGGGYCLAVSSNSTSNPVLPVYGFNYMLSGVATPCVVCFTNNNALVRIYDNSSAVEPSHSIVVSTSAVYLDIDYVYANLVYPTYDNPQYSILSTMTGLTAYDRRTAAIADILSATYSTISYNSGVVAVAGPKLAYNGSTVEAYITTPSGVTVTSSDISVTKGGVTVPFSYSNGTLTFTA